MSRSGQEKRGRLFYEAPPLTASKNNDTSLPTASCIPQDTPNGPILPIHKQRERVCYPGNSGAHCVHIITKSAITLGTGTYKYGRCTSNTNINIYLIDLP